ncbi:MAG: hypothetical protein LBN95_04495 [Prevotellaceae bacterium]|jgi:hypothetical protein|nr:hypothetical protein [Prevotellaceae bacterium]
MKLGFIEKPRKENLAAKNSFTSLLTNGEMNAITGGLNDTLTKSCTGEKCTSYCGTHTLCATGKSSCEPYYVCAAQKRCDSFAWLQPIGDFA